jgi:hypothetical protein
MVEGKVTLNNHVNKSVYNIKLSNMNGLQITDLVIKFFFLLTIFPQINHYILLQCFRIVLGIH